jgi:arylformamidase
MFTTSNLTETSDSSLESKKFYYDLSANISEDMVVFPGDPEFKRDEVSTLESGSDFHLCQLHFGNHMGTHIDFPAHVIKGGKTSNDFDIADLIGNGLIIEVPPGELSVTKDFVKKHSILCNDFVFFRTANSKLSKYTKFSDKYVYIEPDAAEELINIGVKIVGIDYMSVDKYDSVGLPVHKSLLSRDILVVEGLELNNVPMGRCKIFIMPIKINGMDGLPVRVVARR